MLKTSLATKLQVMLRTNVLFKFVEDVTNNCIEDKSLIRHSMDTLNEIIKIGVLENPIISNIYIYYSDKSNKIIGKLVIEIDWERHEIHLSSNKNIEVDSDLSPAGQVSQILNKTLQYTRDVMKKLNVTRVEFQYGIDEKFKRKMENDEDSKKIYSSMPFGESNADLNKRTSEYNSTDFKISIRPEKMDEVKLTLTHNT
ncbi:hypothetical protein [Niveispirillum sp. KHB5.9]|uniref:hypothetical protein n=1 Tax=Niveispirillum sp. KHB5.9 TaxID=3400269 RepID=UPI003A8A9856